MPKPKDAPVCSADMNEYLAESSDFSFELKVLKTISDTGCKCRHNGTYDDPVTKKPRAYDIRAFIKGTYTEARLAVECKNLRRNYPLLVSRVPRRDSESFHEVMLSYMKRESSSRRFVPAVPGELTVESIRIKPSKRYGVGDPVGKVCAQVGRDSQDKIVGSDQEVYDKWSQALSSAYDLVTWSLASTEYPDADVRPVSAVLPVLVVPDERLWVADFDELGEMTEGPRLSNHCTLYVDKSDWVRGGGPKGFQYSMSHVEVMTPPYLGQFIQALQNSEDVPWAEFFPEKRLRNEWRTRYGAESLFGL
jgi:hypothetical protein